MAIVLKKIIFLNTHVAYFFQFFFEDYFDLSLYIVRECLLKMSCLFVFGNHFLADPLSPYV